MRRQIAQVGLALMLSVAFGCAPDGPSESGAEAAIDKAMATQGATVLGITLLPQANIAEAKVKFVNLPFTEMGQPNIWNGTGDAVFTHYTNGTWVLTAIKLDVPGWDIEWTTLNTPVE